MLRWVWLFLACCVPLFGCMGAINQRVSEVHTDSAMISLENGDWDSARRHWARAVNNAELENESDATRSMLHYEYGRALGVTCFFDLAQQELLESLELDRISSGPFHMPLLELARLNLDQKKWVESQRYYEELFLVYDAVGAEDIDPASVALVYEEYALTLQNIGGQANAGEWSHKAEALRVKAAGKLSPTERTPYGTECFELGGNAP